jgi:multidrug efflux pump subunit AcrA (membrane-fusion protein)
MDLETREAEQSARREAINQAEIDVGHCEIQAPFDAVVTERLVSIGTYVSPGTAVIGLLETAGQEVSAQMRETEVESLQEADQLVFEAAAGSFPVRLRTLLPALDTTARTREARLVFSADAAIPGTAGRLVWRGRRLVLPADYLVRRHTGLGIFVLRDGHAQFVSIPQAQEGQPASVDLPADTRLITEGRWRLTDGEAVTIAPAREQP